MQLHVTGALLKHLGRHQSIVTSSLVNISNKMIHFSEFLQSYGYFHELYNAMNTLLEPNLT